MMNTTFGFETLIAILYVGISVLVTYGSSKRTRPLVQVGLAVTVLGGTLCILADGLRMFSIGWALSLMPSLLGSLARRDDGTDHNRLLDLTNLAGLLLVVAAFWWNGWADVAFDAFAGQESAAPTTVAALLVVAAMLREGIFPFHTGHMSYRNGEDLNRPLFLAGHAGLVLIAKLSEGGWLAPSGFEWMAGFGMAAACLYLSLVLLAASRLDRLAILLHLMQTVVSFGLLLMVDKESFQIVIAAAMLSTAGILWIPAVVQARTGRLRLDDGHLGLYAQMPLVANVFLLFCLVITNLPGTITFVSEELLMHAVGAEHPLALAGVLAGFALSGISAYVAFCRIFCGKAMTYPHCDLLTRERVVATVLGAGMIVFGVFPALLMAA